jgi:hypothetical protein
MAPIIASSQPWAVMNGAGICEFRDQYCNIFISKEDSVCVSGSSGNTVLYGPHARGAGQFNRRSTGCVLHWLWVGARRGRRQMTSGTQRPCLCAALLCDLSVSPGCLWLSYQRLWQLCNVSRVTHTWNLVTGPPVWGGFDSVSETSGFSPLPVCEG